MRSLVHTDIALSQRMALIGCALVPLHCFLCVCTYAAAEIIRVACADDTARARQKAKKERRTKTKTDKSVEKNGARRREHKTKGE
jgi:hypothetical protein